MGRPRTLPIGAALDGFEEAPGEVEGCLGGVVELSGAEWGLSVPFSGVVSPFSLLGASAELPCEQQLPI